MKFSGIVGFFEGEQETKPGIFRPVIVERKYVGDVLRAKRGFQSRSDAQNDEFTVNNQISILSDLYAKQNWASIRYVIWNGVKWKVSSIEVNYPRLTLDIGGFYHDESEQTTGEPSRDTM